MVAIEFIKTYKKYILVVLAVLLIIICGSLLFKPLSNKWDAYLMSRPQIKQLKEEIITHKKNEQTALDSANYYKILAKKYEASADSSKTITIYIKQKTNEEVNNIPNLSVDSNSKQFPIDMDEYLTNRGKVNK
jgi:uncharacterized protein YxeA